VAVDGGGDRWNVLYAKNASLCLPHIVSGDFDSLSSKTLDFFRHQKTVKIVPTADQNFTDFTKALQICKDELTTKVI